MVLKAIFDKATSPEIIVNYPSLLSALESAFDTTLSQDEITSFIISDPGNARMEV